MLATSPANSPTGDSHKQNGTAFSLSLPAVVPERGLRLQKFPQNSGILPLTTSFVVLESLTLDAIALDGQRQRQRGEECAASIAAPLSNAAN